MNMPASSSHISSRIDLNGQPADPVQEKPATLAPADIEALQKTLGSGLAGFARQGDIVELHKRIGEKFEKLPQDSVRTL